MKKIVLAIFSIFLLSPVQAQNYYQFCSDDIHKKNLSGFFMSSSGLNMLSRNIIEKEIEKAIKKETGSKFKIKINNFYNTNIFNGEFKSIKATSKKYAYDGIFLSDINVKTICPYNHISFENNKLYFKQNMVLKFSTFLTQEEFKKTIQAQKLDKRISSALIKFSKYDMFLPIINTLKPISLAIKIDENNKGTLKIEKIEIIEKKFKLEGYILIKKNRA